MPKGVVRRQGSAEVLPIGYVRVLMFIILMNNLMLIRLAVLLKNEKMMVALMNQTTKIILTRDTWKPFGVPCCWYPATFQLKVNIIPYIFHQAIYQNFNAF